MLPLLVGDEEFSLIKALPNEIVLLIIHWIGEFHYHPIPLAPTPTSPTLLECALISKQWHSITVPVIHRLHYHSKITPRIGQDWLVHQYQTKSAEWSRVCLAALACIEQIEWAVGAPRLFYIQDKSRSNSESLAHASRHYPNPKDVRWSKLLGCTLDIHDVYLELMGQAGYPTDNASPMIFRFSERMDLGCFLIFLNLTGGPLILRVKPIGQQMTAYDVGSGLIIWDDQVYGTCTQCKAQLPRVQVCADCRVAQYCSRECQRMDWDADHKDICQHLGFKLYNS